LDRAAGVPNTLTLPSVGRIDIFKGGRLDLTQMYPGARRPTRS
jgi:hypothetical protein